MSHEYTCIACGGTFVSERSDAEARKEAAEIWPSIGPACANRAMLVVCDDCWHAVMEFALREQTRES